MQRFVSLSVKVGNVRNLQLYAAKISLSYETSDFNSFTYHSNKLCVFP